MSVEMPPETTYDYDSSYEPKAAFDLPEDAYDKILSEIFDYQSANPILQSVVPEGTDLRISNLELKQPGEFFHESDDWKPGLYGQEFQAPSDNSGEAGEAPPYQDLLDKVFENTRTFEIVRNHNQALDINISEALEAAGIKEGSPVTLINFDAHSDLWRSDVEDNKESIAQWVNKLLENNPQLSDVYWALPNNFRDDPELAKVFFDQRPALGHRYFAWGPSDTNLYINNETGEIHWDEKPDDYSEDAYRTVGLHKRALSDLPDLSGQNVILSTDLDGFDNSGHDTVRGASVPWQGDEGFTQYLKTLDEKGIRPFMHLVSVSPEYLREEHLEELLKFTALAGDASQTQMDEIVTNARNKIADRYAHDGILTERDAHPSLQMLYRMFAHDKQSKDPDGVLQLSEEDAEYNAVLAETAKLFDTSTGEANEILENFDAKDGLVDSVVEFEAIEALLVRVAMKNIPEIYVRKNPEALDSE